MSTNDTKDLCYQQWTTTAAKGHYAVIQQWNSLREDRNRNRRTIWYVLVYACGNGLLLQISQSICSAKPRSCHCGRDPRQRYAALEFHGKYILTKANIFSRRYSRIYARCLKLRKADQHRCTHLLNW